MESAGISAPIGPRREMYMAEKLIWLHNRLRPVLKLMRLRMSARLAAVRVMPNCRLRRCCLLEACVAADRMQVTTRLGCDASNFSSLCCEHHWHRQWCWPAQRVISTVVLLMCECAIPVSSEFSKLTVSCAT